MMADEHAQRQMHSYLASVSQSGAESIMTENVRFKLCRKHRQLHAIQTLIPSLFVIGFIFHRVASPRVDEYASESTLVYAFNINAIVVVLCSTLYNLVLHY